MSRMKGEKGSSVNCSVCISCSLSSRLSSLCFIFYSAPLAASSHSLTHILSLTLFLLCAVIFQPTLLLFASVFDNLNAYSRLEKTKIYLSLSTKIICFPIDDQPVKGMYIFTVFSSL